MKAIVVTSHGAPDVLEMAEVPVPDIGPGEVRVRVRSVALNFRDVHNRRGSASDSTLPFTPGSDFAGDVVAVGADVTHVEEGDRVVGVALDGAYAEQVVTSGMQVVKLPDDADYDTGAILPVAGLTASFLVTSARLSQGMTVATWAAAGGLGCFLGGLLRARGIESIGFTSSADKAAVAKDAGHTQVVNYREVDVVEAARDLTGGAGVHAVFDSVGGPDFVRSFRMLRDEGQVVLCGRAAGEPDLATVQPELIGSRRALALREFHLNGYILRHFAEVPTRLGQLLDAIATGHVRVPTTAYPLAEAAAAHTHLEAGASVGKLVLHP